MMAMDRSAVYRLWSKKPLEPAARQVLDPRVMQRSYSYRHHVSCMLLRTRSSVRSELAYPLQIICNVC
jgi:hypothetical protein